MSKAQPEKVLEYWDQQVESFDSIYTGEKSGVSRRLDQWLRKDMYERFDWTLKMSGDVSGKSICDLGCGTGRYVIAYAQRGARRVVGIDSAPTMIQRAQELVAQAGVADRCELFTMNLVDVPTTEVFDVTIAVGVFDYVKAPIPFLSTMRKITGGRLLTTWPRLWTWRMPVRKVRLTMAGCPVYFFTAGEIENCLKQAGFVCRQIDSVGAIYCVVAEPA